VRNLSQDPIDKCAGDDGGVESNISRRRTCDRGIWMKPLASAADAGELIGFAMAVSPFDRLRSDRSQVVEKCRYCTAEPIEAYYRSKHKSCS
jgi:hypothetical protein